MRLANVTTGGLSAGADRNALRRIDLPGSPTGGEVGVRLTSDGTKVIAGDPRGIITVIDLQTGARRPYPVAQDIETTPLAVSPDGRQVAFVSGSAHGQGAPSSCSTWQPA